MSVKGGANCFWHSKEKVQIESTAIFLAHFAMVCMEEKRAVGFLSHAFTTVYDGDFEEKNNSSHLQNDIQPPKYTWFELIKGALCNGQTVVLCFWN